MFNRTEKTLRKLNRYTSRYSQDEKCFMLDNVSRLDKEDFKYFRKIGLQVIHVQVRIEGVFTVWLQYRSIKKRILITILSTQVILFGLQYLYLLSKLNMP